MLFTLQSFSEVVMWNRTTRGAGPNGYDKVKKGVVEIGNFSSINISCFDPGNATCPDLPSVSDVNNVMDQFDECEIGHLTDMIAHVNSELEDQILNGDYVGHYFNAQTGVDYYYHATWSINTLGEQVSQISKL